MAAVVPGTLSGIWVCGTARPAAVLNASAIWGVVSLSPVISMARPRYWSGFAKASAANAPMSSMAMSCMTRSSRQGTWSEPFWKNRAGLVKSSMNPAGRRIVTGTPRSRMCSSICHFSMGPQPCSR
jgi:hypothetical protein